MVGARMAVTASVLLLSGCTGTGPSPAEPPPEETDTASRSAAPSTSRPTDPGPDDGAGGGRRPGAGRVQPLAVVIDIHRPPLQLTEQQTRAIMHDRVSRWAELGQPGGRIHRYRGAAVVRRVAGDEQALAVVPASAVTPLVQVATVAGRDPLLEPRRYPLTVRARTRPPVVTQITVTGDIMLGRRVGAATPANPGAALTPLSRRLEASDLTLGNLESTLSDAGAPRQGDDSFFAEPRVVGALESAGFDALSLANNHTGDYGDRALRQTIGLLGDSGIERVGAGRSGRDAWRPALLGHDGVTVGVLAFNAIGETPRATASRSGAAEVRMPPRTGPLDRDDLRRATASVTRLAARVDVVIVMPHWGDQYTNRAVPAQHRVGAALLDAGADIVVGGHPHWVQGVDVHDGRLVVNSLGNFVFDMDFSTETQQGVLLDIVCWDGRVKSVRFTPYVIGSDFAPRTVRGPVAATILDRMWATSQAPFRD